MIPEQHVADDTNASTAKTSDIHTSNESTTKAARTTVWKQEGRVSFQLRHDLNAKLLARRMAAFSVVCEEKDIAAAEATTNHVDICHNEWEREVIRGGAASQNMFNGGIYEMPILVFVSDSHDNQQEARPASQVIRISEEFTHLGTRVWDCAVLMVKYFENMASSDTSSDLPFAPGSRVLELGSGTGLLGIALAKSYGAAVVATEYGKKTLTHLQDNCRHNNVLLETNSSLNEPGWTTTRSHHGISGQVACHELDWYAFLETKNRDDGDDHVSNVSPLDYIVVSDCSLTPREALSVLQVIYHFASPTTQVLVGCCSQREGTATFVQTCHSYFENVQECVDFHPHYKSPRQLILRLGQKRGKVET